MKKKILSIVGRVLAAVLAFTVVAFIGLEIFIHAYNPVETQLARMTEQEELLTINGMILREETYVTYDGSGVPDYAVPDGRRVASGDTVACCYVSSQEADAGRKKAELQAEIDNIRDMSSVNDYYVLDLDHIKGQIAESLYALGGLKGETGLSDLSDTVDELENRVTRKQAATGTTLDFSEKIASLESRIEALEAEISSEPKKVTANRAGYFFSSCDGYENSVDMDTLTEMTAADFAEICPGEVPENAVGKLATGFEWYYVFSADRATAQTFSEGSTVSLRFPIQGASAFSATVKKVNYTDDTALVILRCTNMSEAYAVERTQAVQVVTKKYEGLYVDDSAIHVKDGVMGVYVLVGVEVKFRPIQVLWSCKEYAVCEAASSASEGLQLYDYIITKGNDLYDGKLIYRKSA